MSIDLTKGPSLHVEELLEGGAQRAAVSRGRLWTGRALSILTVLFLLFDAAGKLMMFPQVGEAFVRLGFPVVLGVRLGILLLVCTLLYAIPRTAVTGALLLTAYLGGAVAIQVRAGSPTFETIFPVLFAVLAWAGVYLREPWLGRVLPVRRDR